METVTKREERAEWVAKLREIMPPGSTVYTVLRHVSKAGMARDISVVVIDADGPRDVSGWVARATGWKWQRDSNGGLRVSGCGMDMGFHVVSVLSRVLYPNASRPDYVLSHRWI